MTLNDLTFPPVLAAVQAGPLAQDGAQAQLVGGVQHELFESITQLQGAGSLHEEVVILIIWIVDGTVQGEALFTVNLQLQSGLALHVPHHLVQGDDLLFPT